jgi:hypothetical protein
MKGTKEKLFGTLLDVVLVVVFVLICVSILAIISIEKLVEDTTDQTLLDQQLSAKQNPFPLDWAVHIIFSGLNYQPSEVACEIATKINDDFRANVDGSRQVSNGKNCQRQWCIVQNGVGKFKLETITSVPTSSSWREVFATANCAICEEPPNTGSTIKELDEVCINYNLKAAGDEICTSSLLLRGKIAQFGNNECTCLNSIGVWCDRCDGEETEPDDFCDNSIDRIIWAADKQTGPELVTDDFGSLIDNNPLVRWWRGNELALGKDPSLYMYGILWDSTEKKYDLLFEQIPAVKTTSQISDLNAIQPLLQTDTDSVRFNRLGNWYSEAREIEHIYFMPITEITFQDFLDPYTENVDVYFCGSSSQCFYTDPVQSPSQVCLNNIKNNVDDQIIIKTNIEGGSFEAGKAYDISVKNWQGIYMTKTGFLADLSWNNYCYDFYDKSISIYEVSSVTLTLTVASGSGNLCAYNEADDTVIMCTDSSETFTVLYGNNIYLVATPNAGNTLDEITGEWYDKEVGGWSSLTTTSFPVQYDNTHLKVYFNS